MKTLNKILTLLMVMSLVVVPTMAQRSGSTQRGNTTRGQSQSVSSASRHTQGGNEATRRGSTTTRSHENVAPRSGAPSKSAAPSRNHSNLNAPMSGHPNVAPRPTVHHSAPPKHPAHHYEPVRPKPAHIVHGHAHYVPRLDNRARSFYVDNCKYYHHNGVFYRYYPGYGYGVVSIPYNSCFPVLPFPCRQVIVGHEVYWEGEGSWFYEVPKGYILVEAPTIPVYEVPAPPAPAVVPAKPHVSVQISF